MPNPIEIIPALMPRNVREIDEKVTALARHIKTVQIDVMDGIFVPSRSWPFTKGPFEDLSSQAMFNEEMGLPHWEQVNYEFDLMIVHPERHFENCIRLGATRLVFHIGSFESKEGALTFFQNMDYYYRENCELGIAFKTTDNVEDYKEIFPEINFVQCMGIEKIGFQGQDFDERVLEQIKTVKKIDPDMIVSVDGAVNTNTIQALIKAGATRLVAGSAIWVNSSPLIGLEELNELAQKVTE